MAALLALIYIVIPMRANKATELANTGVRGRAHMLRTTQTGAYIKYQPRVKMRLPIEAPGVTPVRDRGHGEVSLIALGSLQPGRPLTVLLDPADPQRLVIDWSGNSGGPPITFAMEDGRSADLSGDAATTAAVLQILAKHGIQPGDMDLRGTPHIRNEVLDVIQRAGYFGSVPIPGGAQPGQQVPGMPTAGAPLTGMPSPAAPSPAGDDPDPTVRLTKLAELRNAGTITAAEFEEHKRRILSDI